MVACPEPTGAGDSGSVPLLPGRVGWAPSRVLSLFLRLISVEILKLLVQIEIKGRVRGFRPDPLPSLVNLCMP